MTYVIAQPCINVKDAGCVEACPVDCIYEGDDMYYINPEECIDCGECVPACPVEAIFHHPDVPEEWTSFIEKNKAFFDPLPPAATPPSISP
jgi:NAD-dependent dihydropyrimidine dehydrogenase PreA subunit